MQIYTDITLSSSDEALARLSALLPLVRRQAALPEEWQGLHRTLLRFLVQEGRTPTAAELGQMTGIGDVPAALARLREDDLVVLNPQGEVVGAYPVTLEETPHSVKVNGHTLHAMCSVDALAFSPLFGAPTSIESRCHVTGRPVSLQQTATELVAQPSGRDVYVGIRWQPPGTCAAHSLCREMVFFCDRETAAQWQGTSADGTRTVLTLPAAVQLAADFFRPLLAPV